MQLIKSNHLLHEIMREKALKNVIPTLLKNKRKNKIVLFSVNPFSPSSWLIALITRCWFVHAAVQIDGKWYDASESRGSFGAMDVDAYAKRYCTSWEFEGDLSDYLHWMKGAKYDWKGVLGWLFSQNDKKKFYCFEAVFYALFDVDLIDDIPNRVSGCDVRDVLKSSARYQRFDKLLFSRGSK